MSILTTFKKIIPFQSIFSGHVEMTVTRLVLGTVSGVCWPHDVNYLGMSVRSIQGCWSQSSWKFITKVPESHEPQIWEQTMFRKGDYRNHYSIHLHLLYAEFLSMSRVFISSGISSSYEASSSSLGRNCLHVAGKPQEGLMQPWALGVWPAEHHGHLAHLESLHLKL